MLMMSDACDGLHSTALIPRAYRKQTQILQFNCRLYLLKFNICNYFSSVVHLELKLLHNLVVDRAVHFSGVGALQLGLEFVVQPEYNLYQIYMKMHPTFC
jgi:hypothetical protein